MPSSGLGAYQVKIHQLIFGGLFFLLVLMGVRAMMWGGESCQSAREINVSMVIQGGVLC